MGHYSPAQRHGQQDEEERGHHSPRTVTESRCPGDDVSRRPLPPGTLTNQRPDAHGNDGEGATTPEEAATRQSTITREAMARLWADPERRARISA